MEIKNQSKELAPIKTRITKIILAVQSLVIKDELTLKNAINALSTIKEIARMIAAKKREITKPMNDALRATRALFLPLEQSYQSAEQIVKSKMVAYNQKIEAARIAEEEKLEKRVEKGSLKVETAAKKLEEIPEVKTHVVGKKGSMTMKKIKKFKVVAISQLPLEYLIPNEVKIRQAMNQGMELPGVKYWEEDIVSAR